MHQDGTAGNTFDDWTVFSISPAVKTAKRLTEWIVLCLLVKRLGVSCQHCYGRFSTIHDERTLNLDTTLHAKAVQEISTLSKLSKEDFQVRMTECETLVKDAIAANQSEKVINGKWYAQILFFDLKQALNGVSFDEKHFHSKIHATLLCLIEYTQPWAANYRSQIETLVEDTRK